jgi:hypothetical protein
MKERKKEDACLLKTKLQMNKFFEEKKNVHI